MYVSGGMDMAISVEDACKAAFAANSGNCSGFVHAVGLQLGVTITGQADDIVTAMRAGGVWTPLADAGAARSAAAAGKLVIAGMKGAEQTKPDPNGHVVVVVQRAEPGDRYPRAYWGRLHAVGSEYQTLNYAWVHPDCDNVTYASIDIP